MKLNIGCGKYHLEGYTNIDISNYCNPDIQLDIRNGLPFEDNSIDEIVANGVLEMILPNEEFLFVLNELYRVLKPSCKLKGQVPSIDTRVLCLDPFDRRWFKEETFDYFNQDKHSWKEFGTQYGFKGWRNIKTNTNDGGIINFEMTK